MISKVLPIVATESHAGETGDMGDPYHLFW